MVRAICGVHLRDRKITMGLMLTLGLNEAIVMLVMASSMPWYVHVFWMEDGHV